MNQEISIAMFCVLNNSWDKPLGVQIEGLVAGTVWCGVSLVYCCNWARGLVPQTVHTRGHEQVGGTMPSELYHEFKLVWICETSCRGRFWPPWLHFQGKWFVHMQGLVPDTCFRGNSWGHASACDFLLRRSLLFTYLPIYSPASKQPHLVQVKHHRCHCFSNANNDWPLRISSPHPAHSKHNRTILICFL